ncbi:MAG: penicillin-binding protein 1B [Gammaproteobacteria bacterium]
MARRRKARKGRRKGAARRWRMPWGRLAVVACVVLAGYVVWLDATVRAQFEHKRWALPARVYARPLELYTGLRLSAAQFADELGQLHYRAVATPAGAGQVARRGDTFRLESRPFTFWDGREPAHDIRVSFGGGGVTALSDARSGAALSLVRLDPVQIGSIYPARKGDRILVRLNDVPPLLVKALIAVEDRHFYQNFGIEPTSIARAMVANLRAGRVVQGGSTITQQLVKNLFLSNRRTLARKAQEAVMALLVELHYSKNAILETYLNEVYLGQDGARGIHGVGLASQFYFQRPLKDLSLDQIALLVGMVKGPSYYDPRRHPQRALARRNLVLHILATQGVVPAAAASAAQARPLDVVKTPLSANAYPAFLDLVRRQLSRDYRQEDLTSEGLRVFTTLAPELQRTLEQTFERRLPALERREKLPADSLEGAAVVTATDSGEVLALVGGRDPGYAGFNRALDAVRQIGSLVKPAVYLTALEQPERYTLATLLDDSPLSVKGANGSVWTPRNYDRRFHGQVPMYEALAHSYNVPTARLGLSVGAPAVIDTLHKLGVERDFEPFPSLFLGAQGLTPLDVAQMYQTLASGGFRAPLRAVRAVLDAHGKPLHRYPLAVEQVVPSGPVYLVDTALQHVVTEGTGAGLDRFLSPDLHAAGKTGTTDDLRDSWFAGFTGDRLAVVWLGRDDNGPTGLTGASGAMQVWGAFMAQAAAQPLVLPGGGSVTWESIDPASGLKADGGCDDSVKLPFLPGSAPRKAAPCADGTSGDSPLHWLRKWFR